MILRYWFWPWLFLLTHDVLLTVTVKLPIPASILLRFYWFIQFIDGIDPTYCGIELQWLFNSVLLLLLLFIPHDWWYYFSQPVLVIVVLLMTEADDITGIIIDIYYDILLLIIVDQFCCDEGKYVYLFLTIQWYYCDYSVPVLCDLLKYYYYCYFIHWHCSLFIITDDYYQYWLMMTDWRTKPVLWLLFVFD